MLLLWELCRWVWKTEIINCKFPINILTFHDKKFNHLKYPNPNNISNQPNPKKPKSKPTPKKMQRQHDYIIKMVVVGSSAVGKTAIVKRFADNEYN